LPITREEFSAVARRFVPDAPPPCPRCRELEDALLNLQARIFGDGGHRTAQLGGALAAMEEADAAVARLQAREGAR
jgi:hypothetical protein